MTDQICLDPSYAFPIQPDPICEAGPVAVPVNPAPRSEAPPPIPAPAPRLAPLWRNETSDWRANLVASAFTRVARAVPPPALSEQALAYSPLALLPVACSNAELPAESSEDDGGLGGDAPTPDAGTSSPAPAPELRDFTIHATAPCGDHGFITDLDEGIGVCTNSETNQHHLFTWNPANPGTAVSSFALPVAPDQALRASTGEIYITTYGSAGLSLVDPAEGSGVSVPLPATIPLAGLSSSGRSVSSFTPNFPKGLAEIGNRLFIATANMDSTHNDFNPGAVLSYDLTNGEFDWFPTSGYNATSVANANGTLLVVSSGAIDRFGVVSSEAFLDAFHPVTGEKISSLSLGETGAGLSGDIALSQDGSVMVLPTAGNSGRLIVVDLISFTQRTLDLRSKGMAADHRDWIFYPGVQVSPDGNFAVVGNFNTGRVYRVDLRSDELSPVTLTVDSATNDTLGISDGLQIGGEFFLGVGPQILRLSLE